ncbi:MAG: HEPN protein [uncultured bacterium]|nr:MAG: HEPN protein [uncultured bacterium]
MDKDDAVKHWLESAMDNLKLAEDLYKLGHNSWCLFMWHLTIEKTLKAIITQHGKDIPYTHDLEKLAKIAELDLTETMANELKEISSYNLEARYDDYKLKFYKKATKEYTLDWISKCQEVLLWLKNRI